ncbi:hypothetical protein PSECIP111951_00034 [Pseudoalteromonas holothuriae]|uniref:YcaO domain-containing protein n=1 Tax=Pseudoalteromonas holothuriae TaxID=2963714 RepID=A0ABM9GEN5_9GAMM|nr:YcaO-like family protein [Pseudoalteromonas sp. CIP111951]CAH9049791.1 hypothetical protein PSECIP111951_00034 [Pseudoalteromonas sp. CIP111951]
MTDVYFFKEGLNTYKIKQGVIVVGEGAYYIINKSYFPVVENLINGLEISQLFHFSIYESALYLKRLEDLKHQGIVVLGTTNGRSNNNSLLLDKTSKANIKLLCSLSQQFLALWSSIISKIPNNETFTFILTDSFTDKRLRFLIDQSESDVCIIKVRGNNLWLSTLFNRNNARILTKAIQQIRKNQPVINYLEHLGVDIKPITLSEQTCLIEQSKDSILSLITSQLQSCHPAIKIFSLDSKKVETHNINTFSRTNYNFNYNASNIELKDSFILFKEDGGTRTQAPKDTLNALSSFISPITGVITHAVKATQGSSIPVYKSAYYKPLYKTSFEQPTNEAFVQGTMGKGQTDEQSQVSALCETLERYCAIYQGYELSHNAKQSELTLRSFSFHDISPYSATQYSIFNNSTSPESRRKQACSKYNDEKIKWYPVTSLTKKEQVYVPFVTCFSNTPFKDELFGRWNSNGCAAGSTTEEAMLQGILELIERDAVALWWYNKIPLPKFKATVLESSFIEACNETLCEQFDYWLLNLTNNTGVPVIAAIGKDKETGHFSFGFGCHVISNLAAQRALTELCQLIAAKDQNSSIFDKEAIEVGEFLYPKLEKNMPTEQLIKYSDNLKTMIDNIILQLSYLDIEVFALDYTREDIPINTVKVFAPGLCHIWPQLGNPRLYSTPVKLGWLTEPLTEETINQQGLYI